MKNVNQYKSIFLRELGSYFNSPIAYIFIVVFVMLTGALFMSNFFLIGQADMRYFFDLMPLVLCVFIPAVTMRMWAEEKKGNTFELLLTFPMDSYQLVWAKFLAGLTFYAIALAGTVFIPLMLMMTGRPDMGQIIGGYIGCLLVGAFFLSIGIFISGLCKDQIIAFIISMMTCFFFYLSGLDFISELIDGWVPGLGNFLKINFGMTRHFYGLEKGVIDTRDVIYFIVMSVSFLMLNIFSIEDRMKPKAKFLFSMAVVVCLSISMVFNSLIFDIPLGRMDLTEGHIYTISDSTKGIFHKLKAPVLAKLYITPADKMPTALKTLEQDIKDRLEELKVVSNGKLDFKIIHMEPFQQSMPGEKKDSLEGQLQRKGIQPFQVQSIEQDALGIKLVYSAIAIAYKEKSEEIIPNIVPQSLNNLEYDLMSKIYRMTLDKKPVVALLTPLSDESIDPQTLAMLRQSGQMPSQYHEDKYRILGDLLRYEEYDLRRIRLTKDEPLPKDLNTLIIVAPENLNERQRYEINRFLDGGGNVVIAAQGYDYKYSQDQQGISVTPQKNYLGLNELLDNYGVKISDDILMDEKNQVLSVNGGMRYGPYSVAVPVKAPIQIMVDRDNMDQKLSITGRLSSFLYLWGSSLDLDNDKILKNKLKAATLFTSSKESWKVAFQGRPLERTDLEHYGSAENKLPLGVMIEGQFPNPYKGQPPPPWPASSAQAQTPAENKERAPEEAEPKLNEKPGKLLVIGCSKMFEDDLIKQGGALNLFINSVDALTLGDELINIRSHQAIDRVVKKLSEMQKLWFRFLTIVLVPLIMIILGSIRVIFRRKEKEQYLSLLPSKTE